MNEPLSVPIVEKVAELRRRLEGADIPYAFGGAVALAYWTREPRGTRDIDINVFVPRESAESVLATLPNGIRWDEESVDRIKRDGQIRLPWDDIPVDLFFSYEELHNDAERNRRTVPFEGGEIPILGPVELAVFKAMFDRTRDWADIEEMLLAGTLDVDAVREHLERLVGDDDPRLERLSEAVRLADAGD